MAFDRECAWTGATLIEEGPGGAGRSRPDRGSERKLLFLAPANHVKELDEPGATAWRFRIYVQGDATSLVAAVAQTIGQAGARLTDVRLGEPTLEDVFIHLTGRSLR